MRSTLLLFLVLLATAPARAGVILSAPLTPDVLGSTASGFGSLTIADDELSVFLQIIFSGLSGNATSAGYFGSLTFPLLGVPAAQSGSPSGTFSITPTDALALESSDGYFRVSSTFAPSGEEGGEVPDDQLVPEPSSMVLGLLSLSVLLLVHKLRAS
jgi:hypothetical protein